MLVSSRLSVSWGGVQKQRERKSMREAKRGERKLSLTANTLFFLNFNRLFSW